MEGTHCDAEFSFEWESVWVPLMLLDAPLHGIILDISSM